MAAVPTATPVAVPAHRHAQRPGRGDSGLITLEWLLIIGLIAGLAASTNLIVQQVVDDTAEARPDPLVRLLEADVAAAFIAADAQAAFDESLTNPPYDDQPFFDRCGVGLAADFDDVVDVAAWSTPYDPGTPNNLDDDGPAKCDITPKPNLGES